MAKVAPEQQALQGRHRRPRRDPAGETHAFHLRPVFHGFVGVLCLALSGVFTGGPIAGLFIPGFYHDVHAGDVRWIFLISCGGLVCAWIGIRQFRNGVQVTGHKLTIRNELRTYTVDAADIRAITLQPKSGPNSTEWVARAELTGGKSIWIDNFDCGSAGKPPKPNRAAAVEAVRALLGVADSEDPDHALREMTRRDRKGTAVTAIEGALDETQARIMHREAIIRKSWGCINGILVIFLIIAIPDPASGDTEQGLPTWLWWGIGISVVMLALSLLAFRADVPRRIAEIITKNNKASDVR